MASTTAVSAAPSSDSDYENVSERLKGSGTLLGGVHTTLKSCLQAGLVNIVHPGARLVTPNACLLQLQDANLHSSDIQMICDY